MSHIFSLVSFFEKLFYVYKLERLGIASCIKQSVNCPNIVSNFVYLSSYVADAPPEVSAKKAKKRNSTVGVVDDKNSTDGAQAGGVDAPQGEEGGAGDSGASGDATADKDDAAMLGKRDGAPGEAGGQPKKKKRRVAGPPEPKNALVHLNELRPGTQFTFVSQTGPVHAPVFVMSVEVNQQVFHGQGNSKKLAKLRAAELALKSFVQFPDASEAHQLLGRGFLPSTADFTTDADMSSPGSYHNLFSDFSQQGKAATAGGDASSVEGFTGDGETAKSEVSDVDTITEVGLG